MVKEISPGEREMVTFGSEREERHTWTHDSLVSYSKVKGRPRMFLLP